MSLENSANKLDAKVKKLGLLVILLIVIFTLDYFFLGKNLTRQFVPTAPGYYRVVDFYDGDTIAVNMNGKNEKIRMIGVDTPETHHPSKPVQCFGEAASIYTRRLIGNLDVRLELDNESSNRDRYDRLLRYVYLPDGTLVNEKIIAEGYGFAYTSFPFTKLEHFRKVEQIARGSKKGLWNDCNPTLDKGLWQSSSANL